ncbi:hypothetical protein [Streptomyces sp. NPDC056479]|uniref:hypothetical protein n=1 Tax=unclassified Streptomyces TaxID=2593676 RepID=UPI003684581B
MGIRMLHRRTAPAPANANSEDAPSTAPPSVQPFAADASTARIPADVIGPLRHPATNLRGYLALARTALPRTRPARTVAVFVAAARALTEPQAGSALSRPHPRPYCQGPEPDATP